MLEREDVINLLLASIAFEELGLSHIVNSEAEKIQYILGTLPGNTPPAQATVDDLTAVGAAVHKVLKDVIYEEMLLGFKLENVLTIPTTSSTSSTSTTTTTTFTTTETTTETTTQTTTTVVVGSSWAVGTHYDGDNNQYLTVDAGNQLIATNHGVGNYQSPVIIGNVILVRTGDFLNITITTNAHFLMNVVQVNIESNIPPHENAPGQFTKQYSFTATNTFLETIDLSAFSGQTISVAIHGNILMY